MQATRPALRVLRQLSDPFDVEVHLGDQIVDRVESLLASDYAPVQGFILVMATLYVLLNLVIDILYGIIDPRVRHG